MKKEFKASFDVLARMAHAFYENGGMKKTTLYLVSQINWSSFERYLMWLTANNYVEWETDGNDKIYEQTQAGAKMFNTLITCHERRKSSNHS